MRIYNLKGTFLKILKSILVISIFYIALILSTGFGTRIDNYFGINFNKSLELGINHVKVSIFNKINYGNKIIDSQQFNTKGKAEDYIIER